MVDVPPDVTVAAIKSGLEAARAAAETPSGKAVGGNVGEVAVVASRWVRNLMLPLALHNAKKEAYFTKQFESELGAKVQEIPPENIQDPKPSMVGPALEGLGNAFEEERLREKYLNLLAASMDDRRSGGLHPAFGEIIKQLTAEEVGLLDSTLALSTLPIARIRRHDAGTVIGFTIRNHVLEVYQDGRPWGDQAVAAWVDNWVRLGLINVDYGRSVSGDETYAWVPSRPEYIEVQAETNPITHEVTFDKGLVTITDFGRRFARAVAPA